MPIQEIKEVSRHCKENIYGVLAYNSARGTQTAVMVLWFFWLSVVHINTFTQRPWILVFFDEGATRCAGHKQDDNLLYWRHIFISGGFCCKIDYSKKTSTLTFKLCSLSNTNSLRTKQEVKSPLASRQKEILFSILPKTKYKK